MEDKHVIAVTGIVIKDGKYLITKRALNKKAFPGKWTVPGGRLEVLDYINHPKDTSEHWYNVLERVIRREIKEETGLEIKNIKYLTSITFMMGEDPCLIISLYADHHEGEVVLDDESIDHAWVSLEEAKDYDLIEGIFDELDMLEKLLKGEEVEMWEKKRKEGENILVINDLVYGKEEIREQVLIDLINSKPMQRLKKISQYGIPDEYYHKKNFSRYDHSLGVLILLKRLGADLDEQIAGLLHDVSHSSFSHVIDWVIGDPTKEDFQDNNHLNVIENSEVKLILEKAGHDYLRIANMGSFSLLEKEIPSLCADRIDYCLRELNNESINVDFFTSNLLNINGQIVFKNLKVAEKFGTEFLRLQNDHWAGKQAKGRYFILAGILKRALDSNLISMDDLYTTDQEVINKLKESGDDYIIENLKLLKEGLFVEEVNEGGTLLKKKFRYVDPEVFIECDVMRLSDVSESYREILEKEKENLKIERRVIFRKL